MNFKTIVQKVNLHAGLQGTVNSVEGQDYQEYLAEAVRSQYVNLQDERNNFKFLRETIEFTLTTDTEYTNEFLTSSLDHGIARWKRGSVLRNGENQKEIPYDTYWENRDRYEGNTNSNIVTFKEYPPAALVVPSPEAGDVIRADYYRTPQVLEKNTDVPLIPEEFHYLLVWAALEDVAAYLGNQSIYERHSFKHDKLVNKFMRSQVPAQKIKKKPFYVKRNHQY